MKRTVFASLGFLIILSIYAVSEDTATSSPSDEPDISGLQSNFVMSSIPNPLATVVKQPLIQSNLQIPKWERRMYLASELYRVGTFAFDMIGTYKTLTHPIHASYEEYVPCHVYDGLGHNIGNCPPLSISNTMSFEGFFTETGWAKFMGKRNPAGVIAANTLLGGAMWWVDRKIYNKGPKGRKLAIALNFLQGSLNLKGGLTNVYDDRAFLPAGAVNIHWF